MNAVIIEDEILAQERLENLIHKADPSIKICSKLTSIEQSCSWLNKNKPDLIFLDIQLEDGLSFKIFERIKINTPIIFTTAYNQYAIRAFKLNSIDYLLKPIRLSDLQDSLSKLKSYRTDYINDIEQIFKSIVNEELNYKKRFLVQYGNKIKNVETNNISYFFAQEKSVFMTTFSHSTYPVNFSLDKLVDLLDPETFFRINRKIIININSIKNMIPFSRSRIKIDLNPPITLGIDVLVSVERSSLFKEWLDK